MGIGEMRYPHGKVQDAMGWVHLWGAIHVYTMYMPLAVEQGGCPVVWDRQAADSQLCLMPGGEGI